MNDFKKRDELFKEWTRLKEFIKLNEELSWDKAQQLKEKEDKIYKEWKKLDTLNKLKDKIEKEKINENNIRKE